MLGILLILIFMSTNTLLFNFVYFHCTYMLLHFMVILYKINYWLVTCKTGELSLLTCILRMIFIIAHADYLVTKCGVLMMSFFVFFTTTMSVSFTLRETQTRMLKFTGGHHSCMQIFPHLRTNLVICAWFYNFSQPLSMD